MQTNNQQQLNYSVIIPVYNGALFLNELFSRLQKVFTKLNQSFELIFVEDCGQDNSWDVLKAIKKQHPQLVTIIKLTRNFGQHNAILCGMHHCKGQSVITIDDDLQTPPEEIPKLIAEHKRNGADVVYGVYPIKQHAWFKRIGSEIVRKTFKYGAGTRNEGSSFRLISSVVVQEIRSHSHSFIYIDEVLQWYTQKVSAVDVRHLPRASGKSNYPLLKLIFFTLNLIVNYTAIPLRIMTYGGLFFSVVFFFVGLFYIYNKIANNATIGFTSLIAAIFFSTGLILFCLGIIGEYLRRIYIAQNQKPQFSIREKY